MATKKDVENQEIHFKVGDEVWRKGGYFYQRSTITAMEGDRVTLGNKDSTIDDLLPASIFAVPDHIKGLAYETHEKIPVRTLVVHRNVIWFIHCSMGHYINYVPQCHGGL